MKRVLIPALVLCLLALIPACKSREPESKNNALTSIGRTNAMYNELISQLRSGALKKSAKGFESSGSGLIYKAVYLDAGGKIRVFAQSSAGAAGFRDEWYFYDKEGTLRLAMHVSGNKKDGVTKDRNYIDYRDGKAYFSQSASAKPGSCAFQPEFWPKAKFEKDGPCNPLEDPSAVHAPNQADLPDELDLEREAGYSDEIDWDTLIWVSTIIDHDLNK
jgi:hypothetical protein